MSVAKYQGHERHYATLRAAWKCWVNRYAMPDPTTDWAGATVCRRKLMEARGWQVVSIPFFEWSPLAGSQQQQAYLRDRLPAAAIEACTTTPEAAAAAVPPAPVASDEHGAAAKAAALPLPAAPAGDAAMEPEAALRSSSRGPGGKAGQIQPAQVPTGSQQ